MAYHDRTYHTFNPPALRLYYYKCCTYTYAYAYTYTYASDCTRPETVLNIYCLVSFSTQKNNEACRQKYKRPGTLFRQYG